MYHLFFHLERDVSETTDSGQARNRHAFYHDNSYVIQSTVIFFFDYFRYHMNYISYTFGGLDLPSIAQEVLDPTLKEIQPKVLHCLNPALLDHTGYIYLHRTGVRDDLDKSLWLYNC